MQSEEKSERSGENSFKTRRDLKRPNKQNNPGHLEEFAKPLEQCSLYQHLISDPDQAFHKFQV